MNHFLSFHQKYNAEDQYLSIMNHILCEGIDKGDRTGTGMREYFGPPSIVANDVGRQFPLLTSKKMSFKSLIAELVWFMHGWTDLESLQSMGCNFWNPWSGKVDPENPGDMGPIYGKQWRDWGGVDQLKIAVKKLRENPNCRRNIVHAWNVSEIDGMALPPCHMMFQLNVTDGKLNMAMYQRSADWFLGVPYNIASYSAMLCVVAKLGGLEPGYLKMDFGSAHIYKNHREQCVTQLERGTLPPPSLVIEPIAQHKGSVHMDEGVYSLALAEDSLDLIVPEHFVLDGYEHLGPIKADVAV